jgi:hypothetical protein
MNATMTQAIATRWKDVLAKGSQARPLVPDSIRVEQAMGSARSPRRDGHPHRAEVLNLVGRVLRVALFVWLPGLSFAATGSGPTNAPTPLGGNYELSREVIAAGGQRCSGGSYQLIGTVAQAHAGAAPAVGASYRLNGGFHVPALPLAEDLFRNGFEN